MLPWAQDVCHKNLLTPTYFHTVGSWALRGCDLPRCVSSPPLFFLSLSARPVQAPLPLIWLFAFSAVIKSLCVRCRLLKDWMAAFVESVCMLYKMWIIIQQTERGIVEGRAEKCFSICQHSPGLPHYQQKPCWFQNWTSELYLVQLLHVLRGPLFSLIPNCVNTTACKHNDDLWLMALHDSILEGMQKEVI